MKGLQTRVVVAAFAAILFQAEHLHSPNPGALMPGQGSQQSKVPPAAGASMLHQSTSSAEQKTRDPIVLTYENDELTIDTFNAPLGEVLRAICDRTGAIIPIPQEANERVNRHIGPGPVINVLGSLLNETHFDYLIEELNADRNAPVRVVLSLKGTVTHTPSRIETPVLSTAIPDPQEGEEEESREKAISERMALVRQINTQHLRFVQEIQRAQGNPETQ